MKKSLFPRSAWRHHDVLFAANKWWLSDTHGVGNFGSCNPLHTLVIYLQHKVVDFDGMQNQVAYCFCFGKNYVYDVLFVAEPTYHNNTVMGRGDHTLLVVRVIFCTLLLVYSILYFILAKNSFGFIVDCIYCFIFYFFSDYVVCFLFSCF